MRLKLVCYRKLAKGLTVMSATADSGTVFVANSLGWLVALEPVSYTERWRLRLRNFDAVGCVPGGLLAQGGGEIAVFEASSGTRRWSRPAGWGTIGTDDTVLAWSYNSREIQRLEASSGRLLEVLRLAAPLATNPCRDIVVLLEHDATGRAIDPVRGFNVRTGEEQWRRPLLGHLLSQGPPPPENESVGLRATDEHVFMTTSQRLMGIDPATGSPVWHTTMPEETDRSPRTACGRSIVADIENFHSVNLATGRIEWSRPIRDFAPEPTPVCAEFAGHIALPGRSALHLLRPDTGATVVEYRGAIDIPKVLNDDLVMLGSYGELRVLRLM